MKRYVYAMSTINPKMQKNWSMKAVIYDNNEGPIPHIHVYHDADHSKCSYVRLDKPEYSFCDEKCRRNSYN